jgi:hypothetical protein
MIFDCSILKPIYCSDTGTGTGPSIKFNLQFNKNSQSEGETTVNDQNNVNRQPTSSSSNITHLENNQFNENYQSSEKSSSPLVSSVLQVSPKIFGQVIPTIKIDKTYLLEGKKKMIGLDYIYNRITNEDNSLFHQNYG